MEKSNWEKLCEFINVNEFFTREDVENLHFKILVVRQYLFHLKKALYIERLKMGQYKRLKPIDNITVYKCQQIGYDLE